MRIFIVVISPLKTYNQLNLSPTKRRLSMLWVEFVDLEQYEEYHLLGCDAV
jgi:hypothetical protein